MAFRDDLVAVIEDIFADEWTTRNGIIVPDTDDIRLSNDAVEIEGTVLYADLAESTNLVDTMPAMYAAEVYKAYLHCASKIIRSEGETITAFDGDRIMAVYIGDSKNTSATRTALKINYAVRQIINPALASQYPGTVYEVEQVIGIDTGSLFVARTGIRGSNDLVWVGRPANYAAKLCSLRSGNYSSWITSDVYDKLNATVKLSKDTNMWEQRTWNAYGIQVYRSQYWWSL